MKILRITQAFVILLIMTLLACQQADSSPQQTDSAPSVESNSGESIINITATTPMIADWIKHVGGEQVTVQTIIPPSIDPHTFQPGAKDIASITDSNYVFAIGLSYEGGWLTKLLDSHPDIEVVNLGEVVSPITFDAHDEEEGHEGHDEEEGHEGHDDEDGHEGHDEEEGHEGHDEEEGHEGHDDEEGHEGHDDEEGHEGHDEEEGHEGHDDEEGHEGHDHGLYDPHFWFDPLRVSSAVLKISSVLSVADPANASIYKGNANEYLDELKALDINIARDFSTIPESSRKILTEHESLGYLGERYEIEILSAIIPSLTSETGPRPKDMVAAIELIKDEEVSVIFLETETNDASAQRLADETGIRVAEGLSVETLKAGQTYVDFMKYNINLIVSNLSN